MQQVKQFAELLELKCKMDYNICRLCLVPKRTPHRKFKNIFTSFENFNNRQLKIIDAIVECAPIQINENDNLPKDVCVNCLEKLQNSYEFREICLQSDIKLKSLSIIKKQESADNDGSDSHGPHHDQSDYDDDDLNDQKNERIIKEEFQCSLCGYILEDESGIAEHVLTHESHEAIQDDDDDDEEEENKVSSCEESGVEANDQDHDDDDEDEATCNECGKKFISIKSYHRHLKQNHSHEFIKCMHCNRKFPNKDDLNSHNEKLHTFRCKICNETFVSEIQIEKHYIVIHFTTYIKNDADDNKNNSNLCYICGENKLNSTSTTNHHRHHHLNCYGGGTEIDSIKNKDNLLNIQEEEEDLLELKRTQRKTFKCKHCDKSFISSPSLNIHLRIHTGERPYTCEFCNKSFRQKIHLSIHRRIHTGEKNYICDLCPQSFSTNSYLTKHKKKVHSKELVENVKNNATKKKSSSSTCTSTGSGGGSFQCNLCEKSFVSRPSLENHLRTHTGERPFKCEYCMKAFKQKSHLLVHIKTHTDDKRHICEICSVPFITNVNLKRHMATHQKQQVKPNNLLSTRRLGGNRSPFTCNTCQQGFISKQEHSEHVRRLHAGEYPFMCDTCGDVFKAAAALRNHQLIHTEVKAYHCTICSKQFAKKWLLRTHLAVHNDDFPHKCGLCPKRFKWRVARWRHEMRHTGERPYKCSVCNKGFIEAGALRRHLRVHTGERPYKCELCFKSFKVASHLKTHMNVHKN